MNFFNNNRCCDYPTYCRYPKYYFCCCKGEKGDPGEPGPFLSSYLEALGDSQTVNDTEDFVFSIIDKVGSAIDIDIPGTTFTINEPGLYHIEWTINLAADNTSLAHVGLKQNGVLTSYSASSNNNGNFSSGALINVTTTPYTITLSNLSENPLVIEDLINSHSALSIRILRFADGEKV